MVDDERRDAPSLHHMSSFAEQGDPGPWSFITRAGPVTAARRRGTLMVRFNPVELAPAELPGELAAALPPVVRVARGLDHIAELEDASAVSATEPRFALIERLESRGLVVTARADGDYGARLTSCRGSSHRRQVSIDPGELRAVRLCSRLRIPCDAFEACIAGFARADLIRRDPRRRARRRFREP